MRKEDVEELFDLVSVGDRVEFTGETLAAFAPAPDDREQLASTTAGGAQ
jgi:hypothetical protein